MERLAKNFKGKKLEYTQNFIQELKKEGGWLSITSIEMVKRFFNKQTNTQMICLKKLIELGIVEARKSPGFGKYKVGPNSYRIANHNEVETLEGLPSPIEEAAPAYKTNKHIDVPHNFKGIWCQSISLRIYDTDLELFKKAKQACIEMWGSLDEVGLLKECSAVGLEKDKADYLWNKQLIKKRNDGLFQ